jgi:SAM-dependent methyltransferase
MPDCVPTFLRSVSEAFRLEAPIYEFGYGPSVDWLGGTATGSGLAGGLPEGSCLACEDVGADQIDRLEDLTRLPFSDATARTVVAVAVLEHVFEPRKAVEEMVRILAPGGILVLCSQSNGPSPALAERYWRPTPQAVQRLLAGMEATLVGWQGGDESPHTLFGIAAKPPIADAFLASVNHFLDHFQSRLRDRAAEACWWRRLKRRLMGWMRDDAARDRRPQRRAAARESPASERRKAPAANRHFYTAQFVLHLPACEQLTHQLLAGCLPRENTGSRLDARG